MPFLSDVHKTFSDKNNCSTLQRIISQLDTMDEEQNRQERRKRRNKKKEHAAESTAAPPQPGNLSTVILADIFKSETIICQAKSNKLSKF